MADRTMKAGDTFPPLRGEASNEDGPVDLTDAITRTVVASSSGHVITGEASAIWPPLEEDGKHLVWEYDFAEGDTDNPGDYNVELRVLWEAGKLQTFPNQGFAVLTIEANP